MADSAHLSIGEVLSLLQEEFPDVTISKIRFLESQGLLDPERTPSGYRKFYEPDIDRLRWILRQQRENFLPLKVIKDRLADADAGTTGGPGEVVVLPADDEARSGEAGAPTEPRGDGEAAAGGPVPSWMADAARVAAERAEAGARETKAEPEPDENGGDRRARSEATPDRRRARDRAAAEHRESPLDAGPTSVSFNLDELAGASGVSAADLRDLERFGLLAPRTVGPDQIYDGEALVVAQKAAGFLRRGLEARHLRMYKVAAEREAGFLEQVVMPMLKQRNPAARQQALDVMSELAGAGEAMRAALLRQALSKYTDRAP